MMAAGCSNSCPSDEFIEKLMPEELEWPISLRVRLAHLRKVTEIYVGGTRGSGRRTGMRHGYGENLLLHHVLGIWLR
jgi:hypothetical protein